LSKGVLYDPKAIPGGQYSTLPDLMYAFICISCDVFSISSKRFAKLILFFSVLTEHPNPDLSLAIFVRYGL
jgi:hypothetical protein